MCIYIYFISLLIKYLWIELLSDCPIRYTPSFSYLSVSVALYSLDISLIKLESNLFLCWESAQTSQILVSLWTANCSTSKYTKTPQANRGKCNATTTIWFHPFCHHVSRLATEGRPCCSIRNVFGWSISEFTDLPWRQACHFRPKCSNQGTLGYPCVRDCWF